MGLKSTSKEAKDFITSMCRRFTEALSRSDPNFCRLRKRSINEKVQTEAMRILESMFVSLPAGIDRKTFFFLLLKLFLPNLTMVGGGPYGGSNQNRIILFKKFK